MADPASLTSIESHVAHFAPSGIVDLSERGILSAEALNCFSRLPPEVSAGVVILDLSRNLLATVHTGLTLPLGGLQECVVALDLRVSPRLASALLAHPDGSPPPQTHARTQYACRVASGALPTKRSETTRSELERDRGRYRRQLRTAESGAAQPRGQPADAGHLPLNRHHQGPIP